MVRSFALGVICCLLGACGSAGSDAAQSGADHDAAAHTAHENYLKAINSNNIDTFTAMLTDDVVFLAAGSKPIIGKAAVKAWAMDYLNTFKTHWDKPVREFVISGDYAFERYDYTSTDIPAAGGRPVLDTGWGLVVYHRESDGVWRVARDAFGPDHAPVPQ